MRKLELQGYRRIGDIAQICAADSMNVVQTGMVRLLGRRQPSWPAPPQKIDYAYFYFWCSARSVRLQAKRIQWE